MWRRRRRRVWSRPDHHQPTLHTPALLTHTLRTVSSVPALYWFISEVNTGNIFDTYCHTLNSLFLRL